MPASANRTTAPPIHIDPSLGHEVVLSEADQQRLMMLEYSISESIAQGWKSFVDIGLALIEIKAKGLYSPEFPTFEEYCQVKWDIKRSKAYYLMAAAEVVQSLAMLPDVPRPDRESPLRPLLTLKREDAQRAWKLAVTRTSGRRMTARAVQCAVRELKLDRPSGQEQTPASRMDRHQRITLCFSDLLTLIRQRADYAAVLDKVQELHRLVEEIFAKRPARPRA